MCGGISGLDCLLKPYIGRKPLRFQRLPASASQLHEYVYEAGVLQVPSGLIVRTVYPLIG